MQIYKQIFWLLFFSFLGEVGAYLLEPFIKIPASVIGLLLLFLALRLGWLKREQVADVGDWLTANMGILFVPAGVGLLAEFGVIKNYWWQFLVIIVVSVAVLIVVVGRLVQFVKERQDQKGGNHEWITK